MTEEGTGNDESPAQKERRSLHDTHRAELLDRQRSNSESYDKAVLTLASGSLALSLSFIKDILPNVPVPVCTSLLYWSWALLTFAIITTIGSYLLSNVAIDQALEKNREYYLEHNEKALKKTKLSYAVDWVNIGSGILFILARVYRVRGKR